MDRATEGSGSTERAVRIVGRTMLLRVYWDKPICIYAWNASAKRDAFYRELAAGDRAVTSIRGGGAYHDA